MAALFYAVAHRSSMGLHADKKHYFRTETKLAPDLQNSM